MASADRENIYDARRAEKSLLDQKPTTRTSIEREMQKIKRTLIRRYFSDAEIKPPSSSLTNNDAETMTSSSQAGASEPTKQTTTTSSSSSKKSSRTQSERHKHTDKNPPTGVVHSRAHPLSKSFSISSTSSKASSLTLNSEPNTTTMATNANSITSPSSTSRLLKPAKEWMKKFKVKSNQTLVCFNLINSNVFVLTVCSSLQPCLCFSQSEF